jgi:hypothetical protein
LIRQEVLHIAHTPRETGTRNATPSGLGEPAFAAEAPP